ncbi:protein LUTEIN DEFICIENT 5 [Pyrus ussuriensis x Pyrus communis]|uniref:Protein LUTEIN DEFICIENT 5 n=1 Tax=Pyrus ussuriensis x Pyrus communis TaxID=2448454 RepID=A0A5N5F824_9ROSA|nr:protein LUTEIN DEFICIENT 5 [Pyrus ussuriensis x Pyrus communis]
MVSLKTQLHSTPTSFDPPNKEEGLGCLRSHASLLMAESLIPSRVLGVDTSRSQKLPSLYPYFSSPLLPLLLPHRPIHHHHHLRNPYLLPLIRRALFILSSSSSFLQILTTVSVLHGFPVHGEPQGHQVGYKEEGISGRRKELPDRVAAHHLFL